MSPLEKVPFATFYPLQKYLRGTCFFKNDFFKWTHILMFKGDSMYSILSIDATFFSTFLKGIIRKECQSFTNHGHDKTPPTVFNPLSLWLTLPRDMGVSHTQWPPGITRAILACLWFAQGLHKAQNKSKQQSRSIMFRVIPCVQFYRLMQLIFFFYIT